MSKLPIIITIVGTNKDTRPTPRVNVQQYLIFLFLYPNQNIGRPYVMDHGITSATINGPDG